MRKIFILAAALALVACGAGEKTSKKAEVKTQTEAAAHTHADGEVCTGDHKEEAPKEHVHANGEVCTGDHKEETPKEHVHADGEVCTGDHGEGKAAAHDHKEGEACSHDHKEGEACSHDHKDGESCSGDHTAFQAAEGEPVSTVEGEHAHPDPNFTEVQLKDSQAKEANIRIYRVAGQPFAPVIKTTGKVSSNNIDKKIIVAPTSGIVKIMTSGLVDGATIEKGKSLIAISTDNIEGGDVMKKTAARYDAAKADYARANELIKDKLISQTEYNTIKVTFTTAEAEYKALSTKSGKNGVTVSSPIKGYLTELLVKDGEYVAAGTPVAIISGGAKSILTAYVSERYYGRLKNITGANFKTAYNNSVYSIKSLGGKMIAYGKGENDESYLVPVTFEFSSNADILPGSFVEVYLKEKERNGTIIVPLTAITEEQNVFYVYTHRGEQLYRKNEVKLGANDGKFVEILSGVNAGDKVVVNGTYQIKLASSSGAIPAACGHAH